MKGSDVRANRTQNGYAECGQGLGGDAFFSTPHTWRHAAHDYAAIDCERRVPGVTGLESMTAHPV